MLNVVALQGRLGRDPELRQTKAGKNVTTISVCCDRNVDKYAEQSGNTADWFDVVFWDSQAVNFCKHFRKGMDVCIEGRLETFEYTDIHRQDKRGVRIKAYRFSFCGPRKGGSKGKPDVGFEDLGGDDGQLPF